MPRHRTCRKTPATKKPTKHREKQALPANFPVPSQDVVFNFLLLFFIHIWDSIFEKLKTGREQGSLVMSSVPGSRVKRKLPCQVSCGRERGR